MYLLEWGNSEGVNMLAYRPIEWEGPVPGTEVHDGTRNIELKRSNCANLTLPPSAYKNTIGALCDTPDALAARIEQLARMRPPLRAKQAGHAT